MVYYQMTIPSYLPPLSSLPFPLHTKSLCGQYIMQGVQVAIARQEFCVLPCLYPKFGKCSLIRSCAIILQMTVTRRFGCLVFLFIGSPMTIIELPSNNNHITLLGLPEQNITDQVASKKTKNTEVYLLSILEAGVSSCPTTHVT